LLGCVALSGIYEVKVWLPLTLVLIRDIEDTPGNQSSLALPVMV
jgi:hypothetical protein